MTSIAEYIRNMDLDKSERPEGEGWQTAREVSEDLGMAPQSAGVILRKLEADGKVIRAKGKMARGNSVTFWKLV